MKWKVAILGATGVVGQRFVQLLYNHPWFEIEVLTASERSAGKRYGRVCNWILECEMPDEIAEMHVVNSDVKSVEKAGNIDFVFSALPSEIASLVEMEFAETYPVFSKASAHRLEEDVPLLIPEVNPEQLELVKVQSL